MLDIKKIRKDPDGIKASLSKKEGAESIEEILSLDQRRRKSITEGDELKQIRNRVSQEIGDLKKQGISAHDKIEEMRSIGEKIRSIDEEIKSADEKIQEILKYIPNTPHSSVPVGKGEEDNRFVREWGKKAAFNFPVLDHFELAERLDIIDFKAASKVSGYGFPLYKGVGAKLERALIGFMLDYHVKHHGYTEIFPPFLTTRESAFGTGQLPKLEDDMYVTTQDDLFLIPTAEVPITNIHREEILSEDRLPLQYAGYSACFRREAGSHGKETKGLLRVHQFNKVELVKLTLPETSYDEHEALLENAERILQELGLH